MEDMDSGLAAMLVMIAYFKENEDTLFLLVDETSTQADVEAQIALPSTPRLVMLGESILRAKKWMLSIEGKVVLQLSDHSDFASALAVFFGSYYVFNIEYPAEAATSLEFIQRRAERLARWSSERMNPLIRMWHHSSGASLRMTGRTESRKKNSHRIPSPERRNLIVFISKAFCAFIQFHI
ncbi:hypothetical protein MHYP_G00135900 [Metynnis hypsauchen]